MTVVMFDRPGLRAVNDALDDGRAVVVPLASPLPYVVMSTNPEAVNLAKCRPAEQPVGVGITGIDRIDDALALDRPTRAFVDWLLFTERVGVLAPVHGSAPGWLAPATKNGVTFLGGTAWAPAAPIVDHRICVYMSSANFTTGSPAVTALQADRAFDGRILVADGDEFRDPGVPHGSSTVVAVRGLRAIAIARTGINDQSSGLDPDGYLADLARRGPRS